MAPTCRSLVVVADRFRVVVSTASRARAIRSPVAALPTILHVINNGGSAIIMTHLGRPKNGPKNDFSLIHLVSHLEKLSKTKVHFSKDCIGEKAKTKCSLMKPGEITLLENVRFYKEETKGDLLFAKKLASNGDCYINDAFGTAHRAHASTTVIARNFPEDKMFGFLMEEEIKSLEKVLILLICIVMIRPEIFFLHILRDNPDGSGKRINTRANLIDLFVVLCI